MKKKTIVENTFITAAFMIAATLLSWHVFAYTKDNASVTVIYILAVFLIARSTTGYVPGIAASVVSVFCVNIAFTYPLMALNFGIAGYPITFLGMMLVAGVTSALTTRLKEQNFMLMEAGKESMRANLLRAISHDLRTPLTSMIGISDNYRKKEAELTNEEKLRMVNMIYDDANWLLHMVENLLSVTRIRDGEAKVKKNPEPLEEVVAEAMIRFRKRLPEAKVQVSVPEEFLMIPLDATLIEQVIINLLENAVYHSGAKEPVDFYVEMKGTEVWFHVRDYGKGIDGERLAEIFDGGGSSAGDSGDSHKGMGIGLSICKTIVNAHNGRIFARNHERGAEFVFILPIEENQSYGT